MKVQEKIIVMLQARMGSTRLPGKVLLDFNGVPMIEHIYKQVSRLAGYKLEFVLSTSRDQKDDALVTWAEKNGIQVSRWPVDDIAGRLYQSSLLVPDAHVLIRIWGDCVLICTDVLSEMLAQFLNQKLDYITNAGEGRNLPVGLDAEIYSQNLLKQLNQVEDVFFREYPLQYVLKSESLKKYFYRHTENMDILNLTVDYPEDLTACKLIASRLQSTRDGITYFNLKKLYLEQPELFKLFSTAERQGEFKQKLNSWQQQKGSK